jgi:hypothetical protein
VSGRRSHAAEHQFFNGVSPQPYKVAARNPYRKEEKVMKLKN